MAKVQEQMTHLPGAWADAEKRDIQDERMAVDDIEDISAPFPVGVYKNADADIIRGGVEMFAFPGIRDGIRKEVGEEKYVQILTDLIAGAKKHGMEDLAENHPWLASVEADILRGDYDPDTEGGDE